MCTRKEESARHIKDFFVYFHTESKDLVALDYKKPDWLMREQPWYVYVGKFTASYQELAQNVDIPTAPCDCRNCQCGFAVHCITKYRRKRSNCGEIKG